VNGDRQISLEEWLNGADAYRRAAHDAVKCRPGASRLTTGVTLAFLRDLPSVVAKLEGGRTEFPEVRSSCSKKLRARFPHPAFGNRHASRVEPPLTRVFDPRTPSLLHNAQALTTEQLVFGKSERNATGPGPLDWCIAGE
jgi:hypothetical protein